MKKSNIAWASLLCLALSVLWLSQSGYVVRTNQTAPSTFQFPFWDPPNGQIKMEIWEGFTDELQIIQDGSNPRLALLQALEDWAQVSSLTILAGESTRQEVGQDGTNLITVADTPTNRAVVGGALGVAVSITTGAGRIIEADVVFNPNPSAPQDPDPEVDWTTIEPETSGFFNLGDVARHEFGHVWNLLHPNSLASTMFFQGGSFDFDFNELSWDDIAGINATPSYRLPGFGQITGRIRGEVTRSGAAVFGAFVVAVDEFGIVAASGVSLPNGQYEIQGLAPGMYTLFVEPLGGFTPATAIGSGGVFSTPADTNFVPRFANNSLAPSVNVVAGGQTDVHFAVEAVSASSMDLAFIGADSNLNDGFRVGSTPGQAFQGLNSNFILAGDGIDTLPHSQGLQFLGPNPLAGASSDLMEGEFNDGTPFKIYPLIIPQDTPRGPHAAVLQKDAERILVTGPLQIFSPRRFLQAFAQFAQVPASVSPPGIGSQVFLVNTNLAAEAQGKLVPRAQNGERTPIGLSQLPADGFNQRDFELMPGGSLMASSLDPDIFVGSVRAEADRLIGGTVLVQSSAGVTGVGSSRPLYSFVAPFEMRDNGALADTGMAITNLEDRPVRIFVQIQRQDGSIVASIIFTLPAHGQDAQFIREKIGGLPRDLTGSILVTANRKIGATVIRTAPGVFTTFPVLQNRVTLQSFFAQFAHVPAANFVSRLILVNPSAVRGVTNVRIQVRNAEGNPAGLNLNGEPLGNGLKVINNIPPLGSVVLETTGGTVVVGSVEVTANGPIGGVVLFSSPQVGTAGIGESFRMGKAVIPLVQDLAAQIKTGIAAVNPNDKALKILITIRDLAGKIRPEANAIPFRLAGGGDQLPPHGQSARFVDELVPTLPAKFEGSVWIEVFEEDCTVALTALRQSPGVLTTFPAIPLEHALTPAD